MPPRPAPSGSVGTTIQLPLVPRETTATLGSSTKIKLPSSPGMSEFATFCDIVIGDISSAVVRVMYESTPGVATEYSSTSILNNFTPDNFAGKWTASINVPLQGDFWIEVELICSTCSSCCGLTYNTYPQPGTGTVGCAASAATNNLEQGKVKILAKTPYSNWITSVFY